MPGAVTGTPKSPTEEWLKRPAKSSGFGGGRNRGNSHQRDPSTRSGFRLVVQIIRLVPGSEGGSRPKAAARVVPWHRALLPPLPSFREGDRWEVAAVPAS